MNSEEIEKSKMPNDDTVSDIDDIDEIDIDETGKNLV